MAVSVNESTVRPLYTGMIPAKIVALCPTKAELINNLNKPAEKDPVYVGPVESKRVPGQMINQVRLEFHFQGFGQGQGVNYNDITARCSVFGKYEYVPDLYINKFGRFASKAKNPDGYNNLFVNSADAVWPAYDGEMDLMMIMEALCRPKKGQEFFFQYRQHLFYQGYLDELQDTLRLAANNSVQILLGVQTDSQGRNYQTVYKQVVPGWQNDFSNLHKQFLRQREYIKDTDYGPIGDSFQPNDFALRQWSPRQDAGNLVGGGPAPIAAAANAQVLGPPAGGPAPRPAPQAAPRPQPQPYPLHISSDDDNDLPF